MLDLESPPADYWLERNKKFRFPRIVLKDVLGNKLDTYTTLQEAIYRDKWNVKQSNEAIYPNEWRLPKAPPPARPDFSRRGPPRPMATRRAHQHSSVDDTEVDYHIKELSPEDVHFVSKSLANLPRFLQNNLSDVDSARGQSKYLNIVAGLDPEKKYLSQTIKKDSQYVFPGFCTGCRRAGLCYGCERNSQLHTHEDIVTRMGGGYTYWKHDRVKREIRKNDPRNWKVRISQSAGQQTIISLEEEVTGELYYVDNNKRLVLGNDAGVPLDDNTIQELYTMKIWDNVMDVDCDHILFKDESGVEILVHKNNLQQILKLMPEDHPDRQRMLDLIDRGSKTPKRLSVMVDLTSCLGTKTPSSLGELSTQEEGKMLADLLGSLQGTSAGDDTGLSLLTDDSKDTGVDTDDVNDDSSSQAKTSLYKAPKAFQIKKRKRQQIVSQSPFSSNRKYNIPTGNGFQIQKSNKDLTNFMDLNRDKGAWDEPQKFELQKFDRNQNFHILSNGKDDHKNNQNNNGDNHEVSKNSDSSYNRFDLRRTDPPLSPDSGLDSEAMAESIQTYDSGKDNSLLQEQKLNTNVDQNVGYNNNNKVTEDHYSEFGRNQIDDDENHLYKKQNEDQKSKLKKRKEITKKSRKISPEIKTSRESTKSFSDDYTEGEKEDSFIFLDEKRNQRYLNLPTPHVQLRSPDLPSVQHQQKQPESRRPSMKYAVEAPPAMKKPPKKHKPPPKSRLLPKMKTPRRRKKAAEAPVSPDELRDIIDPLDFLAKYCIINPVRLPYYELIFESAVDENRSQNLVPNFPQIPSDADATETPPHKPLQSLSDHEVLMLRDMTLIGHGQHPQMVGYTVPEEVLKKLDFTIESLEWKLEEIQQNLTNIQDKKVSQLVRLVKEEHPNLVKAILSPRKQNKVQKDESPPLTETDITDTMLLERLDKKVLAKLSKSDSIRQLEVEREILIQKSHNVLKRLQQKQEERLSLLSYCEDDFINRQFTERHTPDFRRQQSRLYNTLRPTPNYEIKLDYLQEILQQVNNHLLTDRECDFLYHVLDLPGREKIDFRLFSVIAALSEKVTQLDPMIRKLMNKHDYKALDIKMEKCRELFSFLQDDLDMSGDATATSLALELTAGGLTPEHVHYVLSKFNREGRGLIDFMDFVTYIPLFIEIHQRIIQHPLNGDQDL